METRKRAWKLRESVASENTNPRKKTRYACIVKPRESKRKRVESSLPRNREDHIAERGLILWQYHHWKAKDGSTNVDKRGYSTVAERRRDDPSYRQTQQDHGWTLEYCIFLVYLQNSRNRAQGDLGRKSLQEEPVRIEVERSTKPRKDVSSR